MHKQVAIVEDEPITAEFVSQVVQNSGNTTLFITDSAQSALESILQQSPDILFLDINLKGSKDGIWLANELIRLQKSIKVVFITAYGDKATVEEAARTLPSNFLLKPFTQRDIEIALSLAISKIKSEDSQGAHSITTTVAFSQNCHFCLESETLFRDNLPVKLTAKEQQLLGFFCKRPNRLITHQEMFTFLWSDKEISESTARDLVYRLRKKVPELELESLSSIGYRLVIV